MSSATRSAQYCIEDDATDRCWYRNSGFRHVIHYWRVIRMFKLYTVHRISLM